jgi:hypothetical protein
MKSDVLGCVCAAMLGAAIVVATPAIARGGFGGGGHFGGFGPRFTDRSVAIDRFDRDHRFFFRHHRFRNFAFFWGAVFRIRSLAVLLRLCRLRWVLAPGMDRLRLPVDEHLQ